MKLEAMKKLIKKYEPGHLDFVIRKETAERYYRNQTDIFFGRGTKTINGEKVFTDAGADREEGEAVRPLRNADNRIPRNFHGLIVNQKAAYMFTAPPIFDVGSKEGNDTVADFLGDEYRKNCMELCVNAANASVGWIHYWDGGDGLEWAVVDSAQIIPVFDRGLRRRLMGAIRTYGSMDEDTGDDYIVYEYWTETECQAFRRRVHGTVPEGLHCYDMFADPESGELVSEYRHNFGEVPFIPFYNNNIHTDDLRNIKPLIDVYDKVFSGFINDLEDVQELIFVLSGYGGTDLNGFLQDLKKYKAIKIDGDEAHQGVSTLNIEIPIEARNSVLEATRKAIFEQGQGFDPQPENFGNQSGEALKFMYSLLEMKAGLTETEFQLGFARLVRAACRFHGVGCKKIIQTWTRTSIKNDLEQAQICRDSVGIVSKMTILKNHPFVEDCDKELEQIRKEEEEAQEKAELYGFHGKNAAAWDGKNSDGDVTEGGSAGKE